MTTTEEMVQTDWVATADRFGELVRGKLAAVWRAGQEVDAAQTVSNNKLADAFQDIAYKFTMARDYEAAHEAARCVDMIPGPVELEKRAASKRSRHGDMYMLKVIDPNKAVDVANWTPVDRVKLPSVTPGQYNVVVLSGQAPFIAA